MVAYIGNPVNLINYTSGLPVSPADPVPTRSVGSSIAAIALLTNVAGNVTGAAVPCLAGLYTLRCIYAGAAGNTVKPQQLDVDGTTWVDIPKDDGSGNASFTATGSLKLRLTTDTQLRGVVSGGFASTGVYLVLA